MDLHEFLSQLQADVIGNAQSDIGSAAGGEGHFKEDAFTELVADELSDAGVLESPAVCHHVGGAGHLELKVSGFGIPDEDTRLDLLITVYFAGSTVETLNSADVERTFRKLLRFVGGALTPGFREELEPGSDAYAMVSEIYNRRGEIDRIRLMLLTNGLVVTRKEAERKDTFKDYRLSYEIWDLERIHRLRSSGIAQEAITVDVTKFAVGGIPCVSMQDGALGYKTCVALFPGAMLHDLYDEYGTRLLELNVRSYLQARGKVNKGILETLLTKPDRFLAYNNGITVVAEGIDVTGENDRLLAIKGMQIVNGGQTTASIHRAYKENGADLAHVYVQAKLTVVPAAEFDDVVPEISRFSNRQNKVSEVDLHANHAYQVGIERMSRRLWAPGERSKWFYERARGSYQTERAKNGGAARQKFDREYPPSQRFTKEDLARYGNSWEGLPQVVSRGGQKNFVRFMDNVPAVVKGWEMPADEFKQVVARGILYRQTQRIAVELDVPSFRVNVVNYTVSLVAELTARRIDLVKIWGEQDISASLRRLVKEWLPRVAAVLTESAGRRNPTEWFKAEECWRNLRDVAGSWAIPDDTKAELVVVGGRGGTSSYVVANSIAKCLEIDAETWFKIQMWGSQTGKLLDWQCGIANTLAGYAAGGWRHRPSEKQAKRGVEILQLADEFLAGRGR